jgi:putative holliday junction resolvase
MTILDVHDFWGGVQNGDRVMSLDVGSKTIGLATAVWGSELVMPLKTIWRVKFTADAGEIVAVTRDYDIRALVVGWPLLPDGRAGKRCQSVRDFTAELDRFLLGRISITFWDERFSTAYADESVDNIGKIAGKSVSKNRDDIIDSLAAQKILEDFMFNTSHLN